MINPIKSIITSIVEYFKEKKTGERGDVCSGINTLNEVCKPKSTLHSALFFAIDYTDKNSEKEKNQ